jgi:hypothetical protein
VPCWRWSGSSPLLPVAGILPQLLARSESVPLLHLRVSRVDVWMAGVPAACVHFVQVHPDVLALGVSDTAAVGQPSMLRTRVVDVFARLAGVLSPRPFSTARLACCLLPLSLVLREQGFLKLAVYLVCWRHQCARDDVTRLCQHRTCTRECPEQDMDTSNPRSGVGASRRMRLPRFLVNEPVGLGQVVKRITSAAGLTPCGPCERRAARLDRWLRIEPRR